MGICALVSREHMAMTDGIGQDLLLLGGILLVSWLLSLLFGRLILPVLQRHKIGQHINEIGPTWHAGKEGTPTMGGISFIPAFLLTMAGYAVFRCVTQGYDRRFLIPFALTILYAALNGTIGFVDDYFKLVVNKRNEGLTAPQKFLLQTVAAVAYVAMMGITGFFPTAVYIPFFGVTWEMGYFAYALTVLVLVGFVNSTNITDGLDGLASTICAFVSLFVACLYLKQTGDMTVFSSSVLAASLCGCVLGFLVYNRHPARMFMGDTGSLFLGGVLMGCAVMTGQLFTVVLAGFMFVIEMLTSLLQRLYFRATHGKRLFKMAPLHHHFEKCGWKEGQIVALFTGVTVVFCLLSWFGL